MPALTIDCQPSDSLAVSHWDGDYDLTADSPQQQGPAGCLSPWGRRPPGAPCQPQTLVRPRVPGLQTEEYLQGSPRLQQPGNHTPGDSCESTSTPRALPKSVLFEQPEFTLRPSPGGAVKGLGGEADGSGCHQQLVGARSLPASPHPTAPERPGAGPTRLAPVPPRCSPPVVAGGCGVEKD